MAPEKSSYSSHEFSMASGASPFSYRTNSAYQRRVVRTTKPLMHAVLMEKLQLKTLDIQRGIFQITDMGCSIGPNTFISVNNIVESVGLKFESTKKTNDNTEIPKIQVFFSDHAFNDFNTLFTSLPVNKSYYAAAAVGSFYDRVFPDESLHIVNCSYGLHFLSRVPSEVEDKTSLAWNKGKVYYSHSKEEVIREYSRQYEKDMNSFLSARALEVVPGGLVFISVPARPDGTPHSKVIYNMLADTLGSCFQKLVIQGDIDEDEVDSFNIPVYITSPSEVEEAIKRNGSFNIEKLEILPNETSPTNGLTAKDASVHIRAITEGLIEEKFGPKILDKLFQLHTQKLENSYLDLVSVNKSDYAAAAVGSFYDRVFPDESLHIVNCSYGLHFLSRVPSEVEDKTSLAWNKGKVYYSHSKEEVIREYSRQYEKDMNSFLSARALEVVPGGLVFISVPARPDGTPHSKVIYNMLADTLGSCFQKLVIQGDIDEDEVDSFNIPVYIRSPSEVEEAIKRNGSFNIEKLEILPKETSPTNGLTAKDASVHIRAITEGLIEEKFGPKILDKLFQLHTQKLEDAYLDLVSGEAISLFAALKPKTNL
ncbi:hypothetical protein K7X08_000253 [Anisodus acutangulus]|uniref:Uncharacterized protein n=1 Tax=Anisodus acutangulus TaxID=402998 RepID=A0A9Q1RAT1_9SOLA|nr:hypothetical protein K7X08_000253 [Anisodus acutangulus]